MCDRQRRFAVLGLCLSACACACASAPSVKPAVEPAAAAQPAPAAPSAAPAAVDARALGASATFDDLVRAARVLIRSGRADSNAGCLLARDASGFVLDADLMPALDELPDVPLDLDAQLQRLPGPARVLSAWGQAGRAEPELVLTSFTALGADSVRAPVVALLLTEQGVYVRYGAAAASDARALPLETAIAHVLAAPGNAEAVFYVSSEAATPLSTLAQLLHLLPADHAVALALVLPAGTKLPAASARAAAAPGADSCAQGLPELAAGESEGELATDAILGALAPLQSAARDCMSGASGAARAGGKLVLALRIARDGSVAHACSVKDAIGDAALAACVLASARALRFPQPSPAGSVDVQLPLALTPIGPAAQRALCENR